MRKITISPHAIENIKFLDNSESALCMACNTVQPNIAYISENMNLAYEIKYLTEKMKVFTRAHVLCRNCACSLLSACLFKKDLISNYKMNANTMQTIKGIPTPSCSIVKHKKMETDTDTASSSKKKLSEASTEETKIRYKIYICTNCHVSSSSKGKSLSVMKVCDCKTRKMGKIKSLYPLNVSFKCKSCPEVFKQFSSVMSHEKEHVKNEENSRFHTKTPLMHSISKCRVKLCNECGKILKSLSKHKCAAKAKIAAKVLTCEVCGKTFMRYGTYWSHKKYSHSLEKSTFDCSFCQRVFNNSSTLREHTIRNHNNGVLPYVCKICTKGFPTSSKMKRHSMIHSWLKQYRCLKCQTSFSQSAKLKIHMKIHKSDEMLNEEISKNLNIISNSLETISIVENSKNVPEPPTEKSQ